MKATEVRALLEKWFQRELASAPLADPRRGPDCLSLPDIAERAAGAAAPAPEQQRHLNSCPWCRRALELARRLEAQGACSPALTDSAPRGQWPRELRERLAAWLQAEGAGAGTQAPAHFDQDGILHVSWSGLPQEGPVALSLRWGATSLRLGVGVVRGGVLELTAPLAQLGLRDLPVPASALVVEACPVAEERR